MRLYKNKTIKKTIKKTMRLYTILTVFLLSGCSARLVDNIIADESMQDLTEEGTQYIKSVTDEVRADDEQPQPQTTADHKPLYQVTNIRPAEDSRSGTPAKEPAATQEQTEMAERTLPDYDVGFQVSGTKLLDAKGNEFVIRGVNHAHTWYKDYDKTAIPAIAATGANCIRLVLANGIQWSKDDKETLSKVIEQCKQNNLVVVVEVHDGTGSDSIDTLEKIGDYWIEMKDVLIGNEAYVILNIANEWVGSWNGQVWRDGYVSVIPRLRAVGIANTIMVDAAGWGQYGQSIADYGKDVFQADVLSNTMFAIHMYGTAGKDEAAITGNIEGVTDRNLCVCIGEFGYTHSDGDVDEDFLMRYCTENDIGYLAWSWKGNSGGVEYLDIAREWNGSVLSDDWGKKLINGEYGIKKTSIRCSIFD